MQQTIVAVVFLQRELKNQRKFLVQFLNKQDVPKTPERQCNIKQVKNFDLLKKEINILSLCKASKSGGVTDTVFSKSLHNNNKRVTILNF